MPLFNSSTETTYDALVRNRVIVNRHTQISISDLETFSPEQLNALEAQINTVRVMRERAAREDRQAYLDSLVARDKLMSVSWEQLALLYQLEGMIPGTERCKDARHKPHPRAVDRERILNAHREVLTSYDVRR
jgi:hypothetical protein